MFIKLSDEIAGGLIWSNPEYLKRWSDLLFLAATEYKHVIQDTHLIAVRRGQMIASTSFLSARWKISRPTTIKFLKWLESEGMITRHVVYRHSSILTICNYGKYVCDDNVENNIAKSAYNDNTSAGLIRGEKVALARPIMDEPDDIDFIDEMKHSQIWLEQMAIKFSVSSEYIIKKIDAFALDLDCEGTEHKYLREIKKHFCNWLRIQLNIEKDVTDRQRQKDKRRGTDVTATTSEDYKGVF